MGGTIDKDGGDTLRDIGNDTKTVPGINGAIWKHNISDSCLIEIESAIKLVCVINIDWYINLSEPKHLITKESVEGCIK